MLDRHLKGGDYVFIFEFHEDVVVFDSEIEPKKAEFYQIKTKRGAMWKIRELIARATGATEGELKPSILGKLFTHCIDFQGYPVALGFVTNADFEFVAVKEQLRHFASTLEEKDRERIRSAIGDELPPLKPVDISVLIFIRSPLSLDDFARHIKGQLVDFLKTSMGAVDAIGVDSWYKTLISEIEIKNNYSPSAISNHKDLLELKGFSRKQLGEYVEAIKKTEAKKRDWSILETSLINEGVEASRVMKIRRCWDEVRSDQLDSTNLAFHALYGDVELSLLKIDLARLSIAEIIEFAYEEIKSKYDVSFGGTYQKHYLDAVILWGYCEKAV